MSVKFCEKVTYEAKIQPQLLLTPKISFLSVYYHAHFKPIDTLSLEEGCVSVALPEEKTRKYYVNFP